jgi:phosphoribosyl-ATP pyrophosphohydrolase
MTQDVIAALCSVIENRKQNPREGSYTCALLEAGVPRILKKVGEEAAEVVVAGALESDERIVSETADLVYHLLVMLAAKGLTWDDVLAELARRFG